MIEVVYKEEKKTPVGNEGFFHIPRNIRQIGEVDDNYKIYIEDYAYHYLDRITDEVSGGKIALLLGQSNWAEGISYVFIKSAFQLKDMEVDLNHIPFNEEIWRQAGELMEERFPGQEVVGWFFTMPECSMEVTQAMYRAHLNYFAGNDKVLFLMESLDSEEAFFRYDNGKMCRQRGYYLYYERNDTMQEFLIEANHNEPMEQKGEVDDKAVKDFREIISSKKEEGKDKPKSSSYFMYGSTAAAVILALALGTNYMNDFHKLQNAKGTVEQITSAFQSEKDNFASELAEYQEQKPASANAVSASETPKASSRSDQSPSPTESSASSESVIPTESPTPDESDTPTENSNSTGSVTPAPTESISPTPAESPAPTPQETEAAAVQPQSYTIREGDTLTSISKSVYGSTDMIDAICQLNKITIDTTIYPGESILLP